MIEGKIIFLKRSCWIDKNIFDKVGEGGCRVRRVIMVLNIVSRVSIEDKVFGINK